MIGRERQVSLPEVAQRTGVAVAQLREWCATGRLPCDRDGTEWCLGESHVPKAAALATLGRRLAQGQRADGRQPFAAAFRDSVAARHALQELRRQSTADLADVSIAPLAIDGMTLVVVAGWLPARLAPAVSEVVERRGGWFLDAVEVPGDALRDVGIREEQDQTA